METKRSESSVQHQKLTVGLVRTANAACNLGLPMGSRALELAAAVATAALMSPHAIVLLCNATSTQEQTVTIVESN